jgi:hypothetical protein
MARRPFRSRVNDPSLPTMDDDLETLIRKANAIFNEKKKVAQPQPSVQRETPPPRAQRTQEAPAPKRRGLMRRDS